MASSSGSSRGRPSLPPLPKKVFIAGQAWRIKRVLAKTVDPNLADTDYELREFRVKKGLPREMAWIVLTHEVMEAADYQTQPNEKHAAIIHDFKERVDEPLWTWVRDTFIYNRKE